MDENVYIGPEPVNASISPVNSSPPFHTVAQPATAMTPAEKEAAVQANGAKVLGDMETGIRDKLMKMSNDFGAEFIRLHTTYIDMPDEIKAHTMYKALGERIANVEALLNTLMHTAASFPASFPAPVDAVAASAHVPHGAL
jgi:hypothetical protein